MNAKRKGKERSTALCKRNMGLLLHYELVQLVSAWGCGTDMLAKVSYLTIERVCAWYA
jgi:hypothetical protein